MPFEFRYGGKAVDIEDVPLETFVSIEADTGVEWFRLTAAPARYAKAANLLAQACAKQLGIDDFPPLTPKLLVEVFELVEEPNKPVEYEDGMPDPKAADSEAATT